MNTSEGPTTLGVGEVESPSLPSLRPGELFAGRYQVGEVLGVGGFATVFRASDRVLRRDVALKLLRPERASPAAIRRLKREAALARDVAHPSLVRVFEIGESDGLVYLVLELVSGLSLARRIRAGALPLEEVLRIGGALLDGLGALHGAQILHRDIKPSNVLLGSDGAVKVCDFGLALPFDRDETRATVDGAFVGTVDYVAPEIALGDDATVQSDLYSFGVVLFEMIAGQPPFRANSSLGQLLAHLHKRPPELKRLRADVSPWLARYVEWLMAKEPSQRPETVAAARSAFAQRHARLTPRVRTRRWIQSLGAGLFLASAMALGVDAYRSTRFTELVHRPGEGFVALDRKGRTLWRWSDRPAGLHTIVATLESGGEPRVVGAAIDATGHVALAGSKLLVRDAQTGELLDEVRIQFPGLFPDFEDSWGPELRAIDLDGDGGDEVFVSCVHRMWFPSQTLLWEPRVRRTRAFFAGSGHHRFAAAEDLDGDGVKEILLLGINNRLGWALGVAALKLRPAVNQPSLRELPFAGMTVDPVLTEATSTEPAYWYGLARSGRFDLGGFRVDAARRLITVAGFGGSTLETLDLDGFRAQDRSALLPTERKLARADGYRSLRECHRLLLSSLAKEAVQDCAGALERFDAAGDGLLREWSTRQLAFAWLQSGDKAAAVKAIGGLYESSETPFEVAYGFARALHLAGWPTEAAQWYTRGFARGARYEVGRGKFEILEGLAFALLERGQLREAREAMVRFGPSLGGDSLAQFSLALVDWRAGRLTQAQYDALPRPQIDQHRYWTLEFERSLSDGSPDATQRLLERAEELVRDVQAMRPHVTSLRGVLALDLGRVDQAVADATAAFDELIEAARQDTMARAFLPLAAERVREALKAAARPSRDPELTRRLRLALQPIRSEGAI